MSNFKCEICGTNWIDSPHGYRTWCKHDPSDYKAKAFDTVIPSLDILETRLEQGCTIEKQSGKWWLFDKDGEGVCSGYTIRKMLIELIFTDC